MLSWSLLAAVALRDVESPRVQGSARRDLGFRFRTQQQREWRSEWQSEWQSKWRSKWRRYREPRVPYAMLELRSVWVLGRSAARHHVGESTRVSVDQSERGVRYPADLGEGP